MKIIIQRNNRNLNEDCNLFSPKTGFSSENMAAVSQSRRITPAFDADKLVIDRVAFDEVLRERFFYAQAFDIYGGVAGLYDFGPPGCAVKNNVLALWRSYFILFEGALEVDCTCLTPKAVLDASGHTAKFSDYMVRDVGTLKCYRADHLLKSHLRTLLMRDDLSAEQREEAALSLAQVDNFTKEVLDESLLKYCVKAPETGNDLSVLQSFNLMFATSIGPGGDVPGFLRPETAQGIFVNFKKLLNFNGDRLPFAAAQVGTAFRNEISPRAGLLRVREFTLAEIEYFVHPQRKFHPKFWSMMAATKLPLVTAERQQMNMFQPVDCWLGRAVQHDIIGNEALAYFMARTNLFLRKCGIPQDHIRFRQHMRSEMAHYAADCWDAEVRTSHGWIEVVGHADRTSFDLSQHSEFSKRPLTAYEPFSDGPKTIIRVKAVPNKQALGKEFKSEAQRLITHLETLSSEEAAGLRETMAKMGFAEAVIGDKRFKLTPAFISFAENQEIIHGETFTPHVIEPSFGIGRIIYCLLEHAFWQRSEDKKRAVLSIPPVIAPIKVALVPLLTTGIFDSEIQKISQLLSEAGIACKTDDAGTAIGRKYARMDELGVPFAITVDHATLQDQTVTLRDRDSCAQVRLSILELIPKLQRLIAEEIAFSDLLPHAISANVNT